jgi:hypothetical protein
MGIGDVGRQRGFYPCTRKLETILGRGLLSTQTFAGQQLEPSAVSVHHFSSL